ncbi:unnamed protein product [Ceutorhynchus assimilis]|uniref:Uncharacterized protein n=1 Tax=Ceutorhynchus assimilis TaxID=467358 RepID=A0A9N9QJT0_9CUCU|nr:unnamed protein product [Ceutorhynchus assimilis]
MSSPVLELALNVEDALRDALEESNPEPVFFQNVDQIDPFTDPFGIPTYPHSAEDPERGEVQRAAAEIPSFSPASPPATVPAQNTVLEPAAAPSETTVPPPNTVMEPTGNKKKQSSSDINGTEDDNAGLSQLPPHPTIYPLVKLNPAANLQKDEFSSDSDVPLAISAKKRRVTLWDRFILIQREDYYIISASIKIATPGSSNEKPCTCSPRHELEIGTGAYHTVQLNTRLEDTQSD